MKSKTLITTITINKTIVIDSCELKQIMIVFKEALSDSFQQFAQQVLSFFADHYFKNGTLAKSLHCSNITWKTKKGDGFTSILTIFGKIFLPQLVVKNNDTGKRIYITRLLLGIQPRIRIPLVTTKILALMGALASYRVVSKITSIFSSFTFSIMTIMRSVKKTGKTIQFDIDSTASNVFEADGTGIPINTIKKRGKELCVLAQRKKNGGIRIAGMNISSYKKGWKNLFKPLITSLKNFKEIILVTDGDTTPMDSLKKIKVILQRCLFHIAHECKYTLWKDNVKRKSPEYRFILAKILDITNVKRIWEEEAITKKIIKEKTTQFKKVIDYCADKKYKHTVSYLENAKKDLFSGVKRKIRGGTTSLIERVMRTINMRINIAKWSKEGALAVCKIRGAYYYNGFDIK